jgi:hypothetical protein
MNTSAMAISFIVFPWFQIDSFWHTKRREAKEANLFIETPV